MGEYIHPEIANIYSLLTTPLSVAAHILVATALRPRDLLSLTRDNLTEDGIEIATSKTGKALLIEWSPALRTW